MQEHRVGRLMGAREIAVESALQPSPGPGDVVVKVAVTGICGTDLAFYRHGSAPSGSVLGHEFSGRVVAMGDAVSGVSVGDRVVANPMKDNLGLGRLDGSFAEFLRLPDVQTGRSLFRLPDGISDEAGALIEPFAVGLHAVNRATARPEDRAVIFGAGPIGLCVLAGLIARGLKQVLVIDPSALRRELALQMGASAVHDPRTGSSPAFVASHFGALDLRYAREPVAQADIAFDCAGVASVPGDALHSLASKGRLVIVADPHDVAMPHTRLIMLHELSVLGALAYEDEFPEAIALLESRRVDLSPLVSHRFTLDRLGDAFAAQMDADQAVKVLVTP